MPAGNQAEWKMLRFWVEGNHPNSIHQVVWTGKASQEMILKSIRNAAGLPEHVQFVLIAEEYFPKSVFVINDELGSTGIVFLLRITNPLPPQQPQWNYPAYPMQNFAPPGMVPVSREVYDSPSSIAAVGGGTEFHPIPPTLGHQNAELQTLDSLLEISKRRKLEQEEQEEEEEIQKQSSTVLETPAGQSKEF
jgi:hypothetical protein